VTAAALVTGPIAHPLTTASNASLRLPPRRHRRHRIRRQELQHDL